jgi:hypothetical protein
LVTGCPRRFAKLGLDGITAAAEMALSGRGTGSSRFIELRGRLVGEGKLGNQLAGAFLARCADRTW